MRWWKISVHYLKPSDCNDMALATAARLRDNYPGVYFARYCSASESRADFYVQCFANVARARQCQQIERVILTFSRVHLRGVLPTINEPVLHHGSEAHAVGFDCVLKLAKAFALHVDDAGKDTEAVPERDKLNAALADVVHWMHNMLGFDYVDEARQSLYSIERILSIFEACIKAPIKEAAKN